MSDPTSKVILELIKKIPSVFSFFYKRKATKCSLIEQDLSEIESILSEKLMGLGYHAMKSPKRVTKQFVLKFDSSFLNDAESFLSSTTISVYEVKKQHTELKKRIGVLLNELNHSCRGFL